MMAPSHLVCTLGCNHCLKPSEIKLNLLTSGPKIFDRQCIQPRQKMNLFSTCKSADSIQTEQVWLNNGHSIIIIIIIRKVYDKKSSCLDIKASASCGVQRGEVILVNVV